MTQTSVGIERCREADRRKLIEREPAASRSCDMKCAQDCVVTDWSDWSVCDEECLVIILFDLLICNQHNAQFCIAPHYFNSFWDI